MGHWNSTFRSVNMKVLIVLPSLLASINCMPAADALYGGYGYRNIGPASLGYPYAYAPGNAASYNAPLRAAAIPVVPSYPVAAKPVVRAVVPKSAVKILPKIAPVVPKPVVEVIAKAAPVPAVPVVKATAPIVKGAESVVMTQFHAQDELGNYAYGYDNPNSAASVSGNSDSLVSGTYTNKAQGKTTNFVSDALGFKEI